MSLALVISWDGDAAVAVVAAGGGGGGTATRESAAVAAGVPAAGEAILAPKLCRFLAAIALAAAL
jgi:hypothetical protein